VNLPKSIKEKLHISQQVKEEDIELIKEKYLTENISYEIKSFFNNMEEKLSQANLVIARSGASTISELIKVGIPAIFIPYPTASDNHQYYNAKEIINQKAGWLVKESSDSASQLLQIIKSIDQDSSILSTYSANLKKLDMDASNNIAKLIVESIIV
jgi:UDP-N-acetylglucosamine--N-acetylmuramyl-(pentapeptide) pyrophosphoryl-undecaprenol N-acetylglucosamine transferase